MIDYEVEDTLRLVIRDEFRKLKREILNELSNQKYNDIPPVLTVSEAAKVMKIGKNAVYELCRDPEFPAIRDGRKVRILRDKLIRWMEARKEANSRL